MLLASRAIIARMRWPVAIAAAVATIALAACSGGGEPDAGEPAAEISPSTIVASEESSPSATLIPESVGDEEGLASTETPPPEEPEETSTIVKETGPHTTPTPLLPVMAFPDDIALLAYIEPYHPIDSRLRPLDLVRIYSRNGEIIREALSRDGVSHSIYRSMIARPDGSSMVTIGCSGPCQGYTYTEETPASTTIHESRDGGITWQQLATFDQPWSAAHVLPGEDENGQTRLLLAPLLPFFQDDEGIYSQYPDYLMLWPSGEKMKPPPTPEGYAYGIIPPQILLDDGRLAWGSEVADDRDGRPDLYLTDDGENVTELVLEKMESCPEYYCRRLPDGRLLLSEVHGSHELIGPRGAAAGFYGEDSFSWPTIRDPEIGGQWPIRLSPNVLKPGDVIIPLAILQGPFLRVVGVGADCLPIRAEAAPDAPETACAAERVLLTDQGEAVELEGTTWHRVRTPAGIEGWADGRYLE